jgi:hypothetical protein
MASSFNLLPYNCGVEPCRICEDSVATENLVLTDLLNAEIATSSQTPGKLIFAGRSAHWCGVRAWLYVDEPEGEPSYKAWVAFLGDDIWREESWARMQDMVNGYLVSQLKLGGGSYGD